MLNKYFLEKNFFLDKWNLGVSLEENEGREQSTIYFTGVLWLNQVLALTEWMCFKVYLHSPFSL